MSVVSRSALIMTLLAESGRSLSVTEIAQRTGLARSSAHRLLRELEAHHYVMAASKRGGYRLGPGLLKLATTSHSQLVAAMRPIMIGLAQEVNENVDLAVLSGRDVVLVEQVASSQRLRAVTEIGGVFAAHASALGKVLLAQLTDDEVRALLPARPQRFTADTIVDREKFIAELAVVRRSRLAFDHEEHDVGICAVATAVQTPLGVDQAMAVVAPTHRFDAERPHLVAALKRARASATAGERTGAQAVAATKSRARAATSSRAAAVANT